MSPTLPPTPTPTTYLGRVGVDVHHVLQRRDGQVEAVHVMLREDTNAQLRVDANDAFPRRDFVLDQVQQRRLQTQHTHTDPHTNSVRQHT